MPVSNNNRWARSRKYRRCTRKGFFRDWSGHHAVVDRAGARCSEALADGGSDADVYAHTHTHTHTDRETHKHRQTLLVAGRESDTVFAYKIEQHDDHDTRGSRRSGGPSQPSVRCQCPSIRQVAAAAAAASVDVVVVDNTRHRPSVGRPACLRARARRLNVVTAARYDSFRPRRPSNKSSPWRVIWRRRPAAARHGGSGRVSAATGGGRGRIRQTWSTPSAKFVVNDTAAINSTRLHPGNDESATWSTLASTILLLFTFNSRLEAHAVIYNGKNIIADKN